MPPLCVNPWSADSMGLEVPDHEAHKRQVALYLPIRLESGTGRAISARIGRLVPESESEIVSQAKTVQEAESAKSENGRRLMRRLLRRSLDGVTEE